jgi:hypothetical protein
VEDVDQSFATITLVVQATLTSTHFIVSRDRFGNGRVLENVAGDYEVAVLLASNLLDDRTNPYVLILR